MSSPLVEAEELKKVLDIITKDPELIKVLSMGSKETERPMKEEKDEKPTSKVTYDVEIKITGSDGYEGKGHYSDLSEEKMKEVCKLLKEKE